MSVSLFNEQTSENIRLSKNQTIVQDLDVKANALDMYCICAFDVNEWIQLREQPNVIHFVNEVGVKSYSVKFFRS